MPINTKIDKRTALGKQYDAWVENKFTYIFSHPLWFILFTFLNMLLFLRNFGFNSWIPGIYAVSLFSIVIFALQKYKIVDFFKTFKRGDARHKFWPYFFVLSVMIGASAIVMLALIEMAFNLLYYAGVIIKMF